MRKLLPALVLLVAVLGGSLSLDVLTARPALAHATVTATTPADGARLDAAPTEVVVEFDEGVSLGAGYARVLGAGGERVDSGSPAIRDGRPPSRLLSAAPAANQSPRPSKRVRGRKPPHRRRDLCYLNVT